MYTIHFNQIYNIYIYTHVYTSLLQTPLGLPKAVVSLDSLCTGAGGGGGGGHRWCTKLMEVHQSIVLPNHGYKNNYCATSDTYMHYQVDTRTSSSILVTGGDYAVQYQIPTVS